MFAVKAAVVTISLLASLALKCGCSSSTPIRAERSAAPAATTDGYGYEFSPDQVKAEAPAPVPASATGADARIPPEHIQNVLREAFPAFTGCARRAPGIAAPSGNVTVRFVIDGDGDAVQITDGGSTLDDAGVVKCVEDTVRTLAFEAPPRGVITVVYPLAFGETAVR